MRLHIICYFDDALAHRLGACARLDGVQQPRLIGDRNLRTLDDQTHSQSTFGDTAAETTILAILTREPILMNDIINRSTLDPAEAMSALTFLEMKGKIRNLGGQQYMRGR